MQIRGTNGNDDIMGTGAPEDIEALGGNDNVNARGGDDDARGGVGDDLVLGAGGDDILRGSGGNDELRGGGGNDSLRGGLGDDILNGGAGNDTVAGGRGDDFINGGLGNDRIVGGLGDDRMAGGQGRDSFVFNGQNTGDDIINDFNVDEDRLVLNNTEITNIEDTPSGALLTLDNGGTVLLRGVTAAEFGGEVSDGGGDDGGDDGGDGGDPGDPFDPGEQSGSSTATIPSTGQSVTFSVDSVNATDDGTAPIDASIGLTTSDQINIAFVYDESGSISSSTFDLETGALLSLTQSLIDLGFTNDQIDIGLVPFSSSAILEGVFDPADPSDPTMVNPALETALTTRNFNGGTNFEAALQSTETFFASADAGANFVYFISDGFGGGGFDDEVARLTDPSGPNAQILAFAVGSGADQSSLDQIDNTGGSVFINSADDLDTSLVGSPIQGADVDDFFVFVNGAEVAGIDEDDLVPTPFGFVLPEQILSGLLSGAGDTNNVSATVSFDDPDDTTLTVDLSILGANVIDVV